MQLPVVRRTFSLRMLWNYQTCGTRKVFLQLGVISGICLLEFFIESVQKNVRTLFRKRTISAVVLTAAFIFYALIVCGQIGGKINRKATDQNHCRDLLKD